MNKTKIKDTAMRFIVRRAFRHGSASRADLMKAIDISSATATRIMSETIIKHGHILQRNGHDILPKPLAKCPSYADEADFLTSIDMGKTDPVSTGLFEDEIPIIHVSWTNSMPLRPGTLQTIMTAIQRRKQIDIVYIGLTLDQQPRNRKILPLGLEKMNDQWRVVAQDMESPDFPVKVFVLPRIMAASMSISSTRIPYVKGHTDLQSKLAVILNQKFTSHQKQVLEHELNVKDGKISVTTRSLHEFKRRFADTPTSKNIVWPPLVIKEN
jgi:WYL domain